MKLRAILAILIPLGTLAALGYCFPLFGMILLVMTPLTSLALFFGWMATSGILARWRKTESGPRPNQPGS